MSIASWVKGAIKTIRNIGPSIQGDNYGTGTVVGGTTYTQTGPSGTSSSSGGSSRGGGSGIIVSVPGERTGGGGGGGSGSPPPTPTPSPSVNIQEELRKTGGGKFVKNIQTQRELRSKNLVEQYNPRRGTYESTPSPYGQYGQGTTNVVTSRLPTIDEQRKIDVLEGNAATANLENLKSDIKRTGGTMDRIDSLGKQITNLDEKIDESIKGKINEKNEFTGTQEEFKKYEELANKRSNLYSKYEIENQRLTATDRTVDFSFFGKSTPVKVSELSNKGVEFQIFNKYSDVVTGEIGRAYGDIYGSTIAKIPVGKQPQMVLDLNTGIVRPGVSSDKGTIGDLLTPSQVTKGTSDVFKYGKYAVPIIGTGTFASEVGGQLAQVDYKPVEFIKQNPVEAGLIVGVGLLGGGMVARSLVKSSRIKNAVTSGLKSLEKAPLKSVTVYEEGTGIIVAEGIKKTSTGYQKVKIRGTLKKTESGWEFIPSGKETSKIVQKITPEAKTVKFEVKENIKGEPRLDLSTGKKKLQDESELIFSGQSFETGAKGTMIPRGSIGDLKFYETIGTSTSVPKKNIFGMVVIPKTKVGSLLRMKQLRSQLKKSRELPPILKEVKIPTGKADYLQANKVFGLKYSPEELGVVIKIPKTKAIGETFGFTGGGKKSSQEFLEQMYSQVEIKEILKETTKKLQEVSKKGLETTRETVMIKPKTISGLPVGASTYAGTGQYEQMSYEIISPKMMNVQMNNVKVWEESMIKIGTRTGSVSRTIPKEKQIEESLVKPVLKEMTKIVPKEIQKSRLLLKEFLSIKQKQKQKQKLKQIQKINQMLRPELMTKPKIKIPKSLVPLFEDFKSSKGKDQIDEEMFKVFGRRYGKFREVGKAESKKQAKEEARKFSTGTLGASTFIEKGGKKIEFNLGSGFRKSKVDKFVQVQKREQRLSTFGERREIKTSKKKKKIWGF